MSSLYVYVIEEALEYAPANRFLYVDFCGWLCRKWVHEMTRSELAFLMEVCIYMYMCTYTRQETRMKLDRIEECSKNKDDSSFIV